MGSHASSTSDSSDDLPVALHDGNWVQTDSITLSIFDAAVTQAATAVERIRVYNNKPFELFAYLKRWQRSTDWIGIEGLPSRNQLIEQIHALIKRNRAWTESTEHYGILMIASPGPPGAPHPTLVVAPQAIEETLYRRRIETGSPLVVSSVQQPPPESWPRDIKVRCRLHYYRADSQARRQHPEGLAALADSDGSITETSVANVLMVRGDEVISPPRDRILFGVSLAVTETLVRQCGLKWREERIFPEQLRSSDEVLLAGSSCGIWFANQVDGGSQRGPGDVYRVLRKAFDDYIEQSR